MLNISAELKDSIKKSIVLSEFISDAMGVSDMSRCPCPFHEEATPGNSFKVNDETGTWKCYSANCGQYGDVISFDMKYNKRSFYESIKFLAGVANIDLSKYISESKSTVGSQEARYIGIAKKFVAYMREASAACGGDNVIMQRGVSKDVIESLNILCVDKDAHARVITQMIVDNVNPEDISALGFDNGIMFADSIVFVTYNSRFEPRTFQSRTLHDSGLSVPWNVRPRSIKYMYTPKSNPLYQPGLIYGLHAARRAALKEGHMLMVEGHFDAAVLMSHGISNVVAMMGASANKPALQSLFDIGIPRLTMIYDNDVDIESIAGNVFNMASDKIEVCKMPDSLDPDQYVIKHGKDAFLNIVSMAKLPSLYCVSELLNSADMENPRSARALQTIRKCVPYITAAASHVKAMLINEMAARLRIRIEDMYDLFNECSLGETDTNVEYEKTVVRAISSGDDTLISSAMADTVSRYMSNALYRSICAKAEFLFSSGEAITPTTIMDGMDEAATNLIKSFTEHDILPRVDELEFIISRLRDLYEKRSLLSNMRRQCIQLSIGAKSPNDVLDELTTCNAVNSNLITTNKSAVVASILDDVRKACIDPNSVPGYSLGKNWPNLTKCIRGLLPGKLVVLAALQGTGKSMMAGSIQNELSLLNSVPSLYLSYEMGVDDLIKRSVSYMTQIDDDKIAYGNITSSEYKMVEMAANKIKDSKAMHIVQCSGADINDVSSIVRYHVNKYGIKVIFVDYIQLMPISKLDAQQAAHKQIHNVSTRFKELAVKFNITAFVLSQLNRQAYMSSVQGARFVSESFGIAQDADVFMTLQNKDNEQIKAYGPQNGSMLLFIDKVRYSRGGILLHVHAQKNIMRLWEANTDMEVVQ